MRSPSFFSRNKVNSVRSSAGKYSLMFVAIDLAHGGSRLKALHAIVVSRQRDDDRGAAFAQRRFELSLRVDRVERSDDGPELPGAELGDEKLRAVGQQERDPVAAHDTEGRQGRCARVAQALERSVADGRPFEQERRMVGRRACRVGQIVEKRPARVGRERGRYPGIVAGPATATAR